MGIQPSKEPPITEEEIKVLIDQGTQVGVFGEAEQDMVESVFRLNDRSINAIMTPRTEITWLDANDSKEDILKQVLESPHSRFPVARETLDNVVGILNAKDLLEKHLSGVDYDILDLVQKPLFVPENTPAMRVLEMEREAGVHEALVIDEYGGLLGFVTLFDVLEAIVGEIPSYDEKSEPEIIMREDGSYLLDGLLPVDEFKDLLDVDMLPEEDKVGFQTVGGFVMNQVGSIPTAGQHFHWQDFALKYWIWMDAGWTRSWSAVTLNPSHLKNRRRIGVIMILVRMQISGFLSYREKVDIDFTEFDLACISGANGAGKSSLLEAITWTLFGEARRRDDAIINQHSNTAEVILDFDYEGMRYQVQRSKTRDKSTLLEFRIQNADGKWKALTEATLRGTEELIRNSLHLDYETFINASFFLQGKADQFAQQRPGDRKRILSGILGLDIWEEYKEETSRRRRGLESNHAIIDSLLAEIEAELKKKKLAKTASLYLKKNWPPKKSCLKHARHCLTSSA